MKLRSTEHVETESTVAYFMLMQINENPFF